MRIEHIAIYVNNLEADISKAVYWDLKEISWKLLFNSLDSHGIIQSRATHRR